MKPFRLTRARSFTLALSLVGAVAGSPIHAAGRGEKDESKGTKTVRAADSYDELFARYLEVARSTPQAPASQNQFFNNLALDLRARQLNDIVTVRVVESIVGTGSADSNLSKKSGGSAALPGFFGLEGKLPGFIDPTNLAGISSDTTFKGAGSTTRSGALTATMTTRVSEVLPNGDLVLEGVREIDINGDRQIVVLTGVARVVDIAPGNVITSSALGQLRIRYFGRGLMKDSLEPGWIIRILNKIF